MRKDWVVIGETNSVLAMEKMSRTLVTKKFNGNVSRKVPGGDDG